MATNHLNRVVLVVPDARKAAFNAWVRNNLDPSGDDWLTAGLSASGNAPATHWWCSAALTNAEARQVLDRLYALASLTPPDWRTLTRAQVRARLASDRAALQSAAGLRLAHSDNDGDWPDPNTLLAAAGLRRVQPSR